VAETMRHVLLVPLCAGLAEIH